MIKNNSITPIFERSPDIEVIFEFNGVRRFPVTNGYRPMHLISDNYLTTGMHRYYNVDSVEPNKTAKGTITFITPNSYPKCLWIGKKITIQEGEKVIGVATITKIFNHILNSSTHEQ